MHAVAVPFVKTTAVALLLAATVLPALAQNQPTPTATPAGAEPPKPANDQVIVPQVDRRDVKLPRFASNDISIGLFGGTYATANFGASAVGGVRLGYHITEDFFAEATYGRSKVSDEAFRQIFPNGGIFAEPKQTLSYYNVMAGWNILPGEVFFWRNYAKISQGYILAGVGSTNFAGQKRQTIAYGAGLRVVFTSWFAVQADVRDHVYSIDLLGKRQSNHNLELTAGLTFYF